METVKGVDEDLDLLCPICYLYICEPVFTPCRHAFCKNCLVKSFGFNRPPRCPMCRGDCSRVKVMELKIDPEMEAAARKADPDYKERASKRKSERKLWMRSAILSPVVNNDNNAIFEVTGAGSEAVNGIYVVGNIPSYLGPRLYNKPGTQMYIFRWNRREWIIAELNRGFEDRRWALKGPACSSHMKFNLQGSILPRIMQLRPRRRPPGIRMGDFRRWNWSLSRPRCQTPRARRPYISATPPASSAGEY
eukprot:1394921-Amorphochlora_amoeboformis.AAC.2